MKNQLLPIPAIDSLPGGNWQLLRTCDWLIVSLMLLLCLVMVAVNYIGVLVAEWKVRASILCGIIAVAWIIYELFLNPQRRAKRRLNKAINTEEYVGPWRDHVFTGRVVSIGTSLPTTSVYIPLGVNGEEIRVEIGIPDSEVLIANGVSVGSRIELKFPRFKFMVDAKSNQVLPKFGYLADLVNVLLM